MRTVTAEELTSRSVHSEVTAATLLDRLDPSRPPNSPRTVYQIDRSVLGLLRRFETEAWDRGLAAYLASTERVNRLREAQRRTEFIAVNLPDGQSLELTAGGQNVLVKEIIEQFAPRFTPDGYVILRRRHGRKAPAVR